MKKIPTLFLRDPENPRRLTPTVHPDCQWVLDGEGKATRKYNGACCAILKDGLFVKRREVKDGQEPPEDFIQTGASGGKVQGWVPVTGFREDRWFREAYRHISEVTNRRLTAGHIWSFASGLVPGTYELCGPKVQGNPEGFSQHVLIAHAEAEVLQAPRTYEELEKFLLGDFPYEGIVWHHPDGRMAKIKKKDFRA